MKTLVYGLVFLVAFFLASKVVQGGEKITEMSMPTEVGEIVLTMQPCPLQPNHGFVYLAYATEKGHPDHLGCWEADDMRVYVWFPEVSTVAVFAKHLFGPKTRV